MTERRRTSGARGPSLELEISSLAPGGDGVARSPEGLAVFVPHSAPGDKLRARVVESYKTFQRARIQTVITGGPGRVQAPCPVAGRCGGCAWQHLNAETQASSKQSFLLESLKRIGGIAEPPLQPLVSAPQGFVYRNKAQVPAALDHDQKLCLGYYKEGSHDVVPLPAEGCRLLEPAVNDALMFVRSQLDFAKLRPYDQATGLGNLRHVMVRANSKGEAMVALITKEPLNKHSSTVAANWVGFAGIVSVQNNIQDKTGNVILGAQTTVLAGPEALVERLDDVAFRLSATSFFQVNPSQTKALLKVLKEVRPWGPADQVLELYCGVGTLSLPLGRLGVRLHGVENNGAAVEDAKANAKANGLNKLSFETAGADQALGNLPEGFAPTVALFDPPRKGLEPGLPHALAAVPSIRELVYVSCDPASLSRDLKILTASGFELVSVQGVDLFPQTAHVESVSLLRRLDI